MQEKVDYMQDVEKIEKRLEELQKRKDKVDELSREIIRNAGKAVVLVHAGRLDLAKKQLAKLRQILARLKKIDKGFEYYSQQAKQEYAEALAFYVFAKEKRLASLAESGVDEASYLLGMLDLVGELKRHAVDALRKKDAGTAELCYKAMSDIYDSTLHLKFASAIVPELRRKQDTARIQLESVANELLAANNP